MHSVRLIVVSGPSEGTEFHLTSTDVTIGRDISNEIRLADSSVSRRHCNLKPDGDGFLVIDLDSFNGTFVNGKSVDSAHISHGDRLTIGDVSLLLVAHGTIDHRTVDFSDVAPAGSTIRLNRADALGFSLSRERHLVPAETADLFAALLEINATLSKCDNRAGALRVFFDSVSRAVPADHGAFVSIRPGADEFTPEHVHHRDDSPDKRLSISRTVLERVVADDASLLLRDAATDSDFSQTPSIIESGAASIIAAPVARRDEVVGFVYLESGTRSAFSDRHFEFVSAAVAILSIVLESADRVERLIDENLRLRHEVDLRHEMIGTSAALGRVLDFVKRVAPADATVMIRGESGTGKELVAVAIHENSPRSDRQFVAINCAALPESLLESELFGHERGAFTTAVAQKKGRLEFADGGTLFLDELGEMSLATQAKLLRFLQEREFQRVGGTNTISVDVRIIAATNRDLENAIKDGTFREDLFYRLNVVTLRMPPLRERRGDIKMLAGHFAEKLAARCRRKVLGFSDRALAALESYDFPGNIRELENAIERAIVLGNSAIIEPEDLPETIVEASRPEVATGSYQQSVNAAKKEIIANSLEAAGGNYTKAAELLGLHPANLHRLIRTLGIKSDLK